MKLSRKDLRVLIESVISEGEVPEYYVPGFRDRPASMTYTIDQKAGELVLDTFDAGSRIYVFFVDKKDSEGNPEFKKYRNEGAKTSIPWPGGKHKVKLSSQK